MRIILDTSTIIAEDYGRSPQFRTLLAASNALDYQVCVPELALEETVSKYSREISHQCRTMRRDVGQLAKLLGRSLDPDIIGLKHDEVVTSFENDLRGMLSSCSGAILNYPDVPHEVIVRRAISRRRPFDESGSGYRDTLIWLCALELAGNTEGRVILVTIGAG